MRLTIIIINTYKYINPAVIKFSENLNLSEKNNNNKTFKKVQKKKANTRSTQALNCWLTDAFPVFSSHALASINIQLWTRIYLWNQPHGAQRTILTFPILLTYQVQPPIKGIIWNIRWLSKYQLKMDSDSTDLYSKISSNKFIWII
jgi:hypothetical protein